MSERWFYSRDICREQMDPLWEAQGKEIMIDLHRAVTNEIDPGSVDPDPSDDWLRQGQLMEIDAVEGGRPALLDWQARLSKDSRASQKAEVRGLTM